MSASGGILAVLLGLGGTGPLGNIGNDNDDPAKAPPPPAMSSPAMGTPGRLWLGLSLHSSGAHYSLGGEWTPWSPFYFSLPIDGLFTVDFKVSRHMSFPSGDEAPPDSVVPAGPR